APILRYAWEGGYDALLKAGVRIFEYKPEMIHTKLLIADGVWSIIGSANLDSRSDLLNDENVMGIADPKLATALEQVFEKDLANSTEITLSAWQGRSVLEKGFTDVRAQFVLLFAKQL
ncbi:MAG: cardiolipin synthase B, partial [Patescibacteria group bacterium]|nr:cardiolipin synthase B [Patescibacteria group bacterium]